ncbi:MAG: hypothetical protein DBX55_09645 [Verrucomicrobia bacterium]|nr:MAG: hypothetical protein DBX55_09645 [Verrucomicrobiota bacterium]
MGVPAQKVSKLKSARRLRPKVFKFPQFPIISRNFPFPIPSFKRHRIAARGENKKREGISSPPQSRGQIPLSKSGPHATDVRDTVANRRAAEGEAIGGDVCARR